MRRPAHPAPTLALTVSLVGALTLLTGCGRRDSPAPAAGEQRQAATSAGDSSAHREPGAAAGTSAATDDATVREPAAGETRCEMRFSLSGWSAFYKTASGSGTITCDNGETAKVRISSKGGGFSFGKSKITDGVGRFSPVDSIEELFGGYAQAEAHAGAAKSSRASVVTKGHVSLALAGTGRGFDLGVDFGRFEITRR